MLEKTIITNFPIPEVRIIVLRDQKGAGTGYGIERIHGIATKGDKQEKISTVTRFTNATGQRYQVKTEEQVVRLRKFYKNIAANRKYTRLRTNKTEQGLSYKA